MGGVYIKHQQQPTNNTCVSACLAMVLDVPVDEVVDEFHDHYFNQVLEPDEYLIQKGIRVYRDFTTKDMLLHNHITFLTVPSLNRKGLNHQIIAYSDSDEIKVFDPQRGRIDRKYYVHSPDGPIDDNSFNLKSWSVDFYLPVPLERIRQIK